MNKILSTALEAMATMAAKVVSWITLSDTSKQTMVSILKQAILILLKMDLAILVQVMLALHVQVIMYYLKHEQQCFIIYTVKIQGEAEYLKRSDKTRTANDLNCFKNDHSSEFIGK